MSTQKKIAALVERSRERERGFTLVELMVTVAIAMFLLWGLVTVVQNVRQANLNQQAMVQLQDTQRFAMTVLSDMIQQGGYYPNPTGQTTVSALPAVGVTMLAGQAFYGVSGVGAGASDSITVRLMTVGVPAGENGVILCDGSTNPNVGTDVVYTNVFTIVPPAAGVPGQLQCALNGAAPITLATGIQQLQIFYGVNRNAPTLNYNVDTYLPASQMNTGLPGGGDWMNISSVRIVLTFNNPLWHQAGQPQYITFERVVAVMGRAGVHS